MVILCNFSTSTKLNFENDCRECLLQSLLKSVEWPWSFLDYINYLVIKKKPLYKDIGKYQNSKAEKFDISFLYDSF